MQWASFYHQALHELLNIQLPHLLYGVLQRRVALQPPAKGKKNEVIISQILFRVNPCSHQSSAFNEDPLQRFEA